MFRCLLGYQYSWLCARNCVVAVSIVGVGAYVIKEWLCPFDEPCVQGDLFQDDNIPIRGSQQNGQLADESIVVVPEGCNPRDDSRIPILVLYGTEYGFSKEIALKFASQISTLNTFLPRVVDLENFQILDISEECIVFLICSTSGDGVPPSTARAYFDHLQSESASRLDHISYSVLALGDKNYPHFCRSGKILDARFAELGANRIAFSTNIDQQDWNKINTWISSALQAMTSAAVANSLTPKPDYLPEVVASSSISLCRQSKFNKSRPFYSRPIVRYNLTKLEGLDDEKQTIHVEFDLAESELTYVPGDALGVYPMNSPEIVDEVIKLLNASGEELIPTPSWHYADENGSKPPPTMTLRAALLRCYDLKNLKPDLLQVLSQHCADSTQKSELESIFKGTDGKEFLTGRELSDVLSSFPSARPPLNVLLSQVRQLLPRYYSISSSQSLYKDRVCITVAVVRYRTLDRDRLGVTSTYLDNRLNLDEKCPIFVASNPDFRLPENGSTPIIMIGPGTGLSPLRAFLQERAHRKAVGLNILYFGSRHKEKDFLYRDELGAKLCLGPVPCTVLCCDNFFAH